MVIYNRKKYTITWQLHDMAMIQNHGIFMPLSSQIFN